MTDALSDDLKITNVGTNTTISICEDTDIANTVAFLASDRAKYTGQTIHVNGGTYM